MKLLFLDLETTGLCPINCSIIQMAGIIEEVDNNFNVENSKVLDCFHFNCRPQSNINLVLEKGTDKEERFYIKQERIEQRALEIIGKTEEEIMKYPDPVPISRSLVKMFSKHVGRGKKDTRDKLIIVGANPRFDRQFFDHWFRKCYYNFPHGLFDWWVYDVQQLAFQFKIKGKLPTENFRIEVLAEHLGITLKAHDAFEDIKATRKIFYMLMGSMEYKDINNKILIPDPVVSEITEDIEEELPTII